jgi:hypothetical protein
MIRDQQHNANPNLTAARIAAESVAKQEPLAGVSELGAMPTLAWACAA